MKKNTPVDGSRQRPASITKPRSPRKASSVAHGAMFGPWPYDAHTRTLDFVREGGRFPSSVENPGWWMPVDRALHKLQYDGYVPQKTWLTSTDVAEYVRALHTLCEAR